MKKTIILFGATGFTGSFIAHRLLELVLQADYQIVFVGRSETAIRAKFPALPAAVTIIQADVTQPQTLDALFSPFSCAPSSRVSVCIDAVGPFLSWGLPVAAACVRHAIHYVDICGEPLYYLRLVDQLAQPALAQAVSLVPGCGFDCLPTALALSHFRQDPAVESVDGFLSVRNPTHRFSGNLGTLKSAIQGVRLRGEMAAVNRRCFPAGSSAPQVKGGRRGAPVKPFRNSEGDWCTVFMGADNAMQILTDRLDVPAQPVAGYRFFWAFPDLISLLGWFWIVFIIAVCSISTFLESIVMRAPRLFTFGVFSDGVDPHRLHGTQFSWRFQLKNTAGETMRTVRVHGPEPGYVATSGMVVAAAKVLLNNPNIPRGVKTPAIAFANSSLKNDLEQLEVLNFQDL